MVEYRYSTDFDKKTVDIWFKGKHRQFELKIKRSLTVLRMLLEHYPNFVGIHTLDGILNDPNRALSDLRLQDGFENFIEERTNKRNIEARLDVQTLFERTPDSYGSPIGLYTRNQRKILSATERAEIFRKFGGKCNLTGWKVSLDTPDNQFMRHGLIAEFDHRRPLFKGGTNDLDNFQLVSKLANNEKNKICRACKSNNCEECALAYPENHSIILGNGQDLSTIRVDDS
ncbi:MAG: hypothetical protein QXU18_07110 [Thermoplasmatales archaeon]